MATMAMASGKTWGGDDRRDTGGVGGVVNAFNACINRRYCVDPGHRQRINPQVLVGGPDWLLCSRAVWLHQDMARMFDTNNDCMGRKHVGHNKTSAPRPKCAYLVAKSYAMAANTDCGIQWGCDLDVGVPEFAMRTADCRSPASATGIQEFAIILAQQLCTP